MKRIHSTVHYDVPSWNFCNSDNLSIDSELTGGMCKFCHKTKDGHKCLLYDEDLSTKGRLVSKTQGCCKTTAGFTSVIDTQPAPTIQPKELMKQTIKLYAKTVNDLMAQGYPKAIAETVAMKHILGEVR
jgi:hypothetical protein